MNVEKFCEHENIDSVNFHKKISNGDVLLTDERLYIISEQKLSKINLSDISKINFYNTEDSGVLEYIKYLLAGNVTLEIILADKTSYRIILTEESGQELKKLLLESIHGQN